VRPRHAQGEEGAGVFQVDFRRGHGRAEQGLERHRLDFNLLVLVGMRSGLGPCVPREKGVTSGIGQIGNEEKRSEIHERGGRVPRLFEQLAARAPCLYSRTSNTSSRGVTATTAQKSLRSSAK